MKSGNWLWRALGLTTLACLCALLVGFGWALRDTWFPQDGLAIPESPEASTATGGAWADKPELFVTSLGDSLTYGVGDTTGQGYVKRVTDRLADTLNKPVTLVNNLAVNGSQTKQLLASFEQSGVKYAIGKADIVLLTIGGNDLFQIAQEGGSIAEGGDVSPELLEARLPEATPRLEALFKKLRSLNANARIVYVGLYNPFYDLPEMRSGSGIVAKWNAAAYALAEADGNATVVPTYDLFETNIKRYLSGDHFHPNAEGYDRIAERIVQALN
ncbi:GDSL-type esterase/lipase family protein [Cohnella yongneupensis]|uniref:GDSL-type esterase/lipase family protein n=1 Tax=Cohnella yongneupensis TaxID=425006 RepID=A0ABW0R8Y0_9BACL